MLGKVSTAIWRVVQAARRFPDGLALSGDAAFQPAIGLAAQLVRQQYAVAVVTRVHGERLVECALPMAQLDALRHFRVHQPMSLSCQVVRQEVRVEHRGRGHIGQGGNGAVARRVGMGLHEAMPGDPFRG